jgi:broad specificity phosphatase PhoE
MRLILIRHGQTASNVDGLIDTDEPGPGLTALGFAQAAALPDSLGGESIDVLYTSTLVRARQTAAPLAASLRLDARVRDGLREIGAGRLEKRRDAAAVRLYRDTTFAWIAGEVDVRMPGADSGAEVLARYDAVIDEIALSGVGSAAVVSHGAVIACWVAARAGNAPAGFAGLSPLANTGVVVLDGSPRDGWHALTWDGQLLPEQGLEPYAGSSVRSRAPEAELPWG